MLDRVFLWMDHVMEVCGEFLSSNREILDVICDWMLILLVFLVFALLIFTVGQFLYEERQALYSCFIGTMRRLEAFCVRLIEGTIRYVVLFNPLRIYCILRGRRRRMKRRRMRLLKK